MIPQEFFEHYNLHRNPFAEEDAQTDAVFKQFCLKNIFHPTWDKVYGDPNEPATAIVFGEKGSGKTAIRLQIAQHLARFNQEHPDRRLLVVHYDNFNPFLERFHHRIGRRKSAERVLAAWRLRDHMDAILSLCASNIVASIVQDTKAPGAEDLGIELGSSDLRRLTKHQSRDLLLLAACYDQSTRQTFQQRFHSLKRKLRYFSPRVWVDFLFAIIWTLFVIFMTVVLLRAEWIQQLTPFWAVAIVIAVLLGWLPYLWRLGSTWWLAQGVVQHVKIGNLHTGTLTRALMHLGPADLVGQPLPLTKGSDERFEMLAKVQQLLAALNYRGIIVLVDRVDEPLLVNGSAPLMKALIWPLLDNKLLKHPGVGIKMLLPADLLDFIDRETPEFYQRSRLDKQNMVRSFQWTPQSLLDLANARIAACSTGSPRPSLRQWIAPEISDQRLLEMLHFLRVPRYMFKFLYRLIVAHTSTMTAENPQWVIPATMVEREFATFSQELSTFDRGLGAG